MNDQNKRLKIYFAIVLMVAAIGMTVYWTTDFFRLSTAAKTTEQMIDWARMQPQPATDRLVYALQQRLRTNPKDSQSLAYLGNAYLQKVRETADPSYYARAEQVFKSAIDNDSQNAEALTGIGALCLARHDFQEALQWGQRAAQSNPYKAAAYGVISDAYIELDRYDEAVETIQKMVNLRPDLSSYSRVSYVRELMGDVPGAIEAMKLAVSAGAPALENTNWCRMQLGNLYFNSGILNAAEAEYDKTLAIDPEYAPALFGLARVRAAQEKFDEALAILQNVTTAQPLPEYVIELGDLYAVNGRTEEAKQQYELVQALQRIHRENGVQTDAELAIFLADHDLDLPGALKRARAAMQERPSIISADVLAWTLYKNGRYDEALKYSQQALRLGAKNALMHFHAGMIDYRLGEIDKAREHLQKAMAINPHFSVRYAPQAKALLDELNPKTRSFQGTPRDLGR